MANVPAELKDQSRGLRLHVAMSRAGVGSRRACEQMIAEGRVSVNGVDIGPDDMPVWVDTHRDPVRVDGRQIARPRRRTFTYLMVNKPRRVICTNDDPQGRRRIVDLVPQDERLFCVGRLDADSSGLVLLTNDGELAERLTHPRREVAKTYRVTIKGSLDGAAIEKLRRGVVLADRAGQTARARASGVRLLERDADRTRLEITLREGRNREIRRMLARLGHPVKRLRRIAIGPVPLKGVASGAWRYLTRQELRDLRKAAGMRR
ncbi:MAG: pseudouridine synthase [Planctomycetes bacterium]|nr:pseudouridine synthase [Planctomycetota bacterium]